VRRDQEVDRLGLAEGGGEEAQNDCGNNGMMSTRGLVLQLCESAGRMAHPDLGGWECLEEL